MSEKHVGFAARTHRNRLGLIALLVTAALVAAGCSSTTTPGTAPLDADGAVAPATADTPFEIAALGDLARSSRPAVTMSFDTSAGNFELDDGAMLRVPSGAFPGPTDVTVEQFDLAFTSYIDGGPSGTLYVVSTKEDVVLGTPVLLEIPRSSDGITVTQFIDGEWKPISLSASETTVVPIEHFSTISTAIVGLLQDQAAALSGQAPDSSDASYLAGCITAANRMLGGEIDTDFGPPPTQEEILQAQLAGQLAFSLCTRALIDRATPTGERVGTACVGDKIDDDTNFRQAIAECLAADNKQPAVEDTSSDSADASTTNEAATAPDEPTEPVGPVTFTGTATTGAIANGPGQDDLISAEFTATVEGSTVVMDLTLIAHYWIRGGPDDVYVDQNCGATYEHVLHFEGPTGNPTTIQPVVDASRVLEVQGVLCDEDDDQRWLYDVGESTGRFAGQANGLGIDGTLNFGLRSIDISAG